MSDYKNILNSCHEGLTSAFVVGLNELFQNGNFGSFKDIVYKKSGDGVLHVLARGGHIDCLKYLKYEWEGRENVGLEQRNLDGKTALHEASQACQTEAVLFLLSCGAKVDQLKRADWTPLMLAVTKYGNIEVVKALVVAGANVSLQNKDGWTSFHLAVREGDLEMLTFFLESFPSCWDTSSKNGRSPLHTACLSGNAGTVRFLLSKCSYDINCQDSCGTSPLMDAARGNHVNCIQEMAAIGQLNWKLIDSMGRNCLHMAAQSGALDALKVLVDVNDMDVRCATSTNMTALHCAAKEGNANTVEWLLGRGVEVDSRDDNGRTGLFMAVSGQHASCARELVRAGAKDVVDNMGNRMSQLARNPEIKQIVNQLN